MSPTQDPTAPRTDPAAAAPGAGGRLGPETVTDDQAPPEALKDIGTRLSELGEYASYYLSAKADGIKVSIRNLGLYAALGIVAGIAGLAFVATSMVLVCVGVALALAALFDSLWAGALVTGVLFLGVLGVTVVVGMKKITRSSRERTVKKYAARQQQERVRYGTDVRRRAQDPAE